MRDHAATAGVIGLLGVGYAGLGWVSALRSALLVVFMLPQGAKPNFLVGKARDLVALVVIGVTLVASVAVSGLVSGFSEQVLGWLSLSAGSAPALWLVSVVVGLAASTLLFFSLFTLLARPPAPRRALWSGALLGAVAFEVLKWASSYLFAATRNQPAAQAFGIALILLVWINYFSRVVLYAAAWAHTAADAGGVDERTASAEGQAMGERGEASGSGPGRGPQQDGAGPPGRRTDLASAFVAGAGVASAVAAWVALRARRRGTGDGSAGN
jgi:membrane protein